MRFTCGNCGRVYVADDRIAGRAFRMRCKRCGHDIAVGPVPASRTAPPVGGNGVDPARPQSTPEAGQPAAWEAETAFGELSRELQEDAGEPANEDVLELQTVPPPPAPLVRPAPTRTESPPRIAAPVANPPPPGRRGSRPGLAVVAVALAVVAGGAWYLVANARRAPSPVVARPDVRAAAPALSPAPAPAPAGESAPAPVASSQAQATPPAAPPGGAPPASPAPEERPPQPTTAPPARASSDRAEGAKRGPARGPAPAPPRIVATAAPTTSPARAEPEPALVPVARSRDDLPPRDVQEVQASLAGRATSFDGCVADARRDEPELLASPRPVVLTMTVRPNGRVAYPTLDDAQLSGTALGKCLKRESAALVFPESGGEPVRVRMPLVLGR